MVTESFKRILALARNLAKSALKGEEIKNDDFKDILDRKQIEEREALINYIEEGKVQDWKKIWTKAIHPKPYLFLRTFSKVAAVFLGILCFAYLYKNSGIFNGTEKLNERLESSIILKLENGEVLVLEPSIDNKIIGHTGEVIGTKKGNELNYITSVAKSKDSVLIYNELNVPNGRTFKLILSDGTEVTLNAGTTLKYPIRFLNGNKREIFIQGEAYFNVTKDTEHAFIVHTNDINVRVLGTKFVVSSYSDDQEINTVLVEGSVGLTKKTEEFDQENSTFLTPDHKATWNKISKTISVEKVDTENYTGWLNGTLIFEEMPFNDIMKKLERHYNVSIINNNKLLGEKKFTARFDAETINQVLTSFSKNYSFDYKIKGNKVFIN